MCVRNSYELCVFSLDIDWQLSELRAVSVRIRLLTAYLYVKDIETKLVRVTPPYSPAQLLSISRRVAFASGEGRRR